MVQINFAQKQINAKVVYYGPGMSGKTTNLEVVHQRAPDKNRGELTSISTDGDRTLFFDYMPLDLGTIAGMKTCFQMYTVPGQVYYNSTRKLVLQGVDGVIFVADSSPDAMEANLESLRNLEENLNEYGKSLATLPHVIQFNKRDIPGALEVEGMMASLNPHGVPTFEAIAATGQGVFPTLKGLASLVLKNIQAECAGPGSGLQGTGYRRVSTESAPAPAGQGASDSALGQTGVRPAPVVSGPEPVAEPLELSAQQQPVPQQPVHEQPVHQQPAAQQQPAYQQPAYQQPVQQQPVQQPAAHHQPAQQPVELDLGTPQAPMQTPAHTGQPMGQTGYYQQPVTPQPNYHQPPSAQPGLEQTGVRPRPMVQAQPQEPAAQAGPGELMRQQARPSVRPAAAPARPTGSSRASARARSTAPAPRATGVGGNSVKTAAFVVAAAALGAVVAHFVLGAL
ncbi:MAG: GTP-binding protein [Planctomycetota bacterium]|jgi:signal recognition particle receptor subunit beta